MHTDARIPMCSVYIYIYARVALTKMLHCTAISERKESFVKTQKRGKNVVCTESTWKTFCSSALANREVSLKRRKESVEGWGAGGAASVLRMATTAVAVHLLRHSRNVEEQTDIQIHSSGPIFNRVGERELARVMY